MPREPRNDTQENTLPTSPPLPRWPHTPGVTEGPDRQPLEAVKRLVGNRLDAPALADHPAFRYGLALHDAGFFWEAHEVLEALWKALPPNGRERRIVRAVIQLANAELKLRMGRRTAALRLFSETLTVLHEAACAGRPGQGDAAGVLSSAVRARRDAVIGDGGEAPIQLCDLLMKQNA